MKTSEYTRHYRSFSSFSWLLTVRLRHTLLLAALCSLGLIFASCGSDNPTDPEGNGGNGGNGGEEPPAEPTYANVQSIFNSSCALSGCHDSQTQQNGVNLSSYDGIINSVGDQYGENVVQPDDAANSPLVDKIESGSPEFGARMPPNGSYLSEDQINLIKEWINNGANEDDETDSGNNSTGDGGGYY